METVSKSGGEILLSGFGFGDVVALADGRFALVGTDVDNSQLLSNGIFAQFYGADGAKAGSEFRINTVTALEQEFPAATALANGSFVAAWQSDSDNDMRYRIVPGAGVSSALTEHAASTTSGFYLDEAGAVTLSDGSYVIAWSDKSWKHENSSVTTFQRFSATGALLGGETRVSYDGDGGTDYANDTDNPALAALSNGNFVVTWTQQKQAGGTVFDIHGQIYDSSGATVGSEFTANTTTAGNQDRSAVTMLGGGAFVVAWEDGSDGTVKFQRYDATGTAAGSETTVTTAPGHSYDDPSMATLDDGRFVIAWTDSTGSGPSFDSTISAAIFNADGSLSVDRFAVNTSSDGNQEISSIDVLADGRFVIGWQTEQATSASHEGSYAQIFDARTAAANITGNNGLGDQLVGTRFGDTLSGLKGNDKLYGKLGNDTLTGGDGADKFVFDTALNKTSNVDHIFGFAHNSDDILIENAVFKKAGSAGALAGKAFYAGATAHDSDDRILYDKAHGKLYYDDDGKGGHAAVLFAVIENHTTLSAADFVIV